MFHPDMQSPTSAKVGVADYTDSEESNFRSALRSSSTTYAPSQADIDWLVAQGVRVVPAMITPAAIMVAKGYSDDDGIFEPALDGPRWFVFPEPEDNVYWNPTTGEIATELARAFALGEAIIRETETYAFDCALNIFDDPLAWLRAKRDGVVVLDWTIACDWLRDCPRIAVCESLLSTYLRFMQPTLLESFVIVPGGVT